MHHMYRLSNSNCLYLKRIFNGLQRHVVECVIECAFVGSQNKVEAAFAVNYIMKWVKLTTCVIWDDFVQSFIQRVTLKFCFQLNITHTFVTNRILYVILDFSSTQFLKTIHNLLRFDTTVLIYVCALLKVIELFMSSLSFLKFLIFYKFPCKIKLFFFISSIWLELFFHVNVYIIAVLLS